MWGLGAYVGVKRATMPDGSDAEITPAVDLLWRWVLIAMGCFVLAALAPQTIVFLLGGVVIGMVFVLALAALKTTEDNKKFILTVIGLLLGLFGGGGIGALVGSQSASSTASSVKSEVKTVATQAATGAANSVAGAVTNAVRSMETHGGSVTGTHSKTTAGAR